MIQQRLLVGVTHDRAVVHYIHALNQRDSEGDVQDGHLDASELLRRADFEAVGLDRAFVDRYFT